MCIVSGLTDCSLISGRRGSRLAGIFSNNRVTLANVAAGSTSPTITKIALFGAYHFA